MQREDESVRQGLCSDLGVTVLTVDDHREFREALRDLIAAVPGFVLVGQARSGEEAVRAVDQSAPELVLMDVLMPGMGGIAAARVILSRRPGILIVLISVDDPEYYPGTGELGDAVACKRKQDLCPSELERIWAMHQN